MGRFERNPELVLCSVPVKVEMLSLPGMDLPVVPAALSGPLSTHPFFSLRPFCQKAFLTPSLRFSPASSPLPPWQSFTFTYVIKSKQSILLLSCWSRFSEKLLRKFLSLGQEKKNEPNNKPHKNPFSGNLCYVSQCSKRG